MEFRYRGGEEKERVSASLDPLVDSSSTSSTSSSYSYFTQQAILAGIDIGSLLNDQANMSKESLLEEIRRDRLSEEMLVREIARKRKLEEEVLKELENGKQIPTNKFEYRDAWLGSNFERSPFDSQGIKNGLKEIRCSGTVDELKEAEVGNDGPMIFPRVSLDRKFPANKLLGVKRKTSSCLSLSVKKEWSCSLCHVTASSEKSLDDHINGKKHKAKEAQLTRNKTAPYKKSKELSTFDKDDNKPLDKEMDITINKHADEARQQSSKNDTNAWCWIGKVDCNSTHMLQVHLHGKKHKVELEADISGNSKMAIKEVTVEKTVKEASEGQDNVEANEETLRKNNVTTTEETLAKINVTTNEEILAENNVEETFLTEG